MPGDPGTSLGRDGSCVGVNVCWINTKLLCSGDRCVEFKDNHADICLPLEQMQGGPVPQGAAASSGGAANLSCWPSSAVMEERLLGPSLWP